MTEVGTATGNTDRQLVPLTSHNEELPAESTCPAPSYEKAVTDGGHPKNEGPVSSFGRPKTGEAGKDRAIVPDGRTRTRQDNEMLNVLLDRILNPKQTNKKTFSYLLKKL